MFLIFKFFSSFYREKKSRFEQKPMNESDFRKIEQELSDLRQAYQPQSLGLGNHGWGGDSLGKIFWL